MSKLETALKLLAQGEFICEIRFPEEFEVLSAPAGRDVANKWLEAIGYRLTRLSEDGAFFMAHALATTDMRAKFREELKTIRTKLEPIVGFMETLRQAQGRNPQIHAGDMVWESEIAEAVRSSSLLERRLADLRELNGARVTDSSNDRVRRMLIQLENEGYLVETNPTNHGYRVTGKIDYMYQLIAFVAENAPHLADDGVVDQLDPQARLDGSTQGSEAAAL